MIFITGATGLIGSRLLFDLVSEGKKVKALRRRESRMDCVERYLGNRPELLERIEWVEGDITDVFSLEDAIQGVSEVYHCAGRVSFQSAHSDKMYQANVTGTANLVNVCLGAGIRKFCHVSSVAAIGRPGMEARIDESESWQVSKNNSWYAVTKYGSEREVWRGMAEGLTAVIVNPAIVIGPGDWRTDSSMLFGQVWNGLHFYTDGVTGFVDVRDVCSSMRILMEGQFASERYILVSENKPFREVLGRMAVVMGMKPASIHAGPFLSSLAWRAERLRSFFTGRKPVITKETARSAQGIYHYSNKKVVEATGFKFIPVMQSVDETAELFLREKRSL
jgi:nucleoside-diphosphate-sugar epimerase